ncbi:MAG: hypothetical protein EOP23_06760 [Hyphomicrobiales bacterium]|nr:MAG: hypothetical protein EOP23_06760 [Hyphomicrobiales bacterium]
MNEPMRYPMLVAPTAASAEKTLHRAAQLQKDAGFHSTLVCVERAAEMIRTLQNENELARRQIAALREQLSQEKQDSQKEADKLNALVGSWHDRAKAAEKANVEASALAVAAIAQCEELAAHELELRGQLKQAESRAVEAENYLTGLQNAIEFELSSVLP